MQVRERDIRSNSRFLRIEVVSLSILLNLSHL